MFFRLPLHRAGGLERCQREFLARGIPTYGISGDFGDPDGNGAHGLNEYLRVKVVYDCRDYLYRLMKIYGEQ